MSSPTNPLADNNVSINTESETSKPTSTPAGTRKTETETETAKPLQTQPESATDTNTDQKTDTEISPESPIKPKPKIKRCPHIQNIKKKIKPFKSLNCNKCHNNSDPNDRLVFCLTCFKLNCPRTATHAHGYNHWLHNSKHNIVMMLPTFAEFSEHTKEECMDLLDIWCYKCDVFLHEINQHTSPKIRTVKTYVYGCLTRSYKKLSNKEKAKYKKQNDYSNIYANVSPNVSKKNKKKKKDKYAQYKNQFTNQQTQRGNNRNNSNQSLEKWCELDTDFITQLSDDSSNGYIGIFGLSNLGNTCFFNSILQNLIETRPLIKAFTDSQEMIAHNANEITKKDRKSQNKNGGNKHSKNDARARRNNYGKNQKEREARDKKLRGRLLTEFHHIITEASSAVSKHKSCVTPSGLLNAVIARNRRFAGRRQQDSHELMRVLVEGMRDQNEKILKKTRKDRLRRHIAQWDMNDVIQWCECYEIRIENISEIISVKEFKQFLGANGKNDGKFWTKLGLNDDSEYIRKFKQGRVYLVNEECDYYCTKHGYENPNKIIKSLKRERNKSPKVHDIDSKGLHKINTIIDDVFGGNIQSCVTCYGCGNVSRMTEEFFDLSLPISNPKTKKFNNYSNNAWFTKKKSKKQKKKDRQKQWAQQNRANKQSNKKQNKKGKKNKGNKHSKKVEENEENIELNENVTINISKADEENNGNDSNENKSGNVSENKENKFETVTENKSDTNVNESAEIKDAKEIVTPGLSKTENENEAMVSKSETLSEVNANDNPSQSDEKEEKKEKYVPPTLPKVRGMDRLKGECTLLDCLAAFTDAELLTGNDKYGCKYCTRVALDEMKVNNNEKWTEIITNYLIFEDKIKENNPKTSDESERESESDESEIEMEQILDEIDRIIDAGYPLKRHNATKQILIHKPPQILALHLKRFEQNGFRLSKVSKRVRFPLHLDMTKYLTEECKERENGNKCMYQLYGISVHHGSMGGGHYIAYTHKYRGNGPKEGWYYFSDSTSRAVDYKDPLRAEAYVLFYQKCESNNSVDEEAEQRTVQSNDDNNDNA